MTVSDIVEARRALVAQARVKLSALSARQSLEVDLPADLYGRREAYRQIAGAAHHLFGPGNYWVCVNGTKMTVTRDESRNKPGRKAWNTRWRRIRDA